MLQTLSCSAVAPATLAALYLWSPLAVAAAVGGSPAGLENAAVFGALAAAATINAAAAGFALAAAAYLGLHPVLLTVSVPARHWLAELLFDGGDGFRSTRKCSSGGLAACPARAWTACVVKVHAPLLSCCAGSCHVLRRRCGETGHTEVTRRDKLGCHVQAAIALLLWRGPEPLHVQPAPQLTDSKTLQPTANGSESVKAAAGAATPQKPQDQQDADQAAGDGPERGTQQPDAAFGSPVEGSSGFGLPLELHPSDAEATAAAAAPGSDAARQPESLAPAQHIPAQPAASEDGSRAAAVAACPEAAARFRRDFRRRRRLGGVRNAATFLAWLALGCGALALLSDLALRRFPEHRCGGLLRCMNMKLLDVIARYRLI